MSDKPFYVVHADSRLLHIGSDAAFAAEVALKRSGKLESFDTAEQAQAFITNDLLGVQSPHQTEQQNEMYRLLNEAGVSLQAFWQRLSQATEEALDQVKSKSASASDEFGAALIRTGEWLRAQNKKQD